MRLDIIHRVSIPNPTTHLVHVETTIAPAESERHATEPALPESLVLFLPVWTPGSYLVREYSRHVEGFTAEPPVRAAKIRKNAWRLETRSAQVVVVGYRVYANELTVRTSHVDETHAFLVGAALFFGVEGAEASRATVEVVVPSGWRVVTSLGPSRESTPGIARFEAPDFDALVDSPIALGVLREERFDAVGTPHRYAFWPGTAVGDADARRLVDDTRAIAECEAKLFGGSLPYASYDLILHLSSRPRGGLEHRASASLLAPPTSFATREAYLDLLSLVAHEMFHAWNIKRIRPAGLTPFRYEEECYTRQLWWFEGGTSYYDWRVLRLAGLCTVDEYLVHVGSEIAYLDQTPGRLVQSLEDASFDAWIKLYRPDENSSNSTVSYYRKGEVVCALLDLELRGRTFGRATLDHVLAHLWNEYGVTERPVPEDGLQGVFERVAGVPLGDLFEAWVRSPREIDYAPTLERVGLWLERVTRADAPPCSLALRLRADGGKPVVVSVARQGAAWRAGIDPGDEILAIGGARIEGASLDGALRRHAPGDRVEVVVSREGAVLTRHVALDGPRADRYRLVGKRDASPAAREAFAAWLRAPHPATTGEGST
ncbi:MAG: PDZ domain-containing protein [Myxococcota bacterium]|nr:PDZ domain-containing protein [Myxococcota bacterium]